MKSKVLKWSVAVIAIALILGLGAGFSYYSQKYDDQFASIKTLDPNMKIRESRVIFQPTSDRLSIERIYESNVPVWSYCDEAIKANPKTNLITAQIKRNAFMGGSTWFIAQFKNPTSSSGIFAEITGGVSKSVKLGQGLQQLLFMNEETTEKTSKTTLHLSTDLPADPIEKLLYKFGFYQK